MNLFQRYEGNDFDESFSLDDAEYIEEGSSKPFLVKAIAMILAVTGIAYGANIALSPNGGSEIEFGQGVLTTAACDTQDGITLFPNAGYVNDVGTGKFSLDSIILENIDASCVGMDFTIQVYADSGTALTVSESATSAGGASYRQFDLAQFYFQDSNTVVALDDSYMYYYVLTDTSADSTEFADNLSSINVVFDPDRVLSFADATAIRRITIQTSNH